jgi:hypothetical protein
MSDQKLRDLERRFKETGSPDDEAAWLLERVRVGDLTRERLELAAYCGHEGARRAVGIDTVPHPENLKDWHEGLRRWGVEIQVRGGSIAARRAMSLWEAESGDRRPWAALAAVEEWLACPCADHDNAAARAQRPLVRARRTFSDAIEFISSIADPSDSRLVRVELSTWALTPARP